MKKRLLSLLFGLFIVTLLPSSVCADEIGSDYITINYADHEVRYGVLEFVLKKDIDISNENVRFEFERYLCTEYLCANNSTYTKVDSPIIKEDNKSTYAAGDVVFFGYGEKNYDEFNAAGNAVLIRIIDETGNGEEIIVGLPLGDHAYNVAKITKITPENTSDTTEEPKDKVVVMPEDKAVSSSILEEIKTKGTKVTYEQKENDVVSYAWIFDGAKMTNSDYNVNLSLNVGSSKNQNIINSLIPASKDTPIYLEFAHSGDLPLGTQVKVNVASTYSNDDILTLYYFNETTKALEKVAENIKVEDGFVVFELAHCSDYVLLKDNKAPNNAKTGNINLVFYTTIGVISLIGIIGLVISKKRA